MEMRSKQREFCAIQYINHPNYWITYVIYDALQSIQNNFLHLVCYKSYLSVYRREDICGMINESRVDKVHTYILGKNK